MTNNEARAVLLEHRPERPRKTKDRQLQVAIDVALSVMDTYEEMVKSLHVEVKNGK